MTIQKLNQETLKEKLLYDPDKGVFTKLNGKKMGRLDCEGYPAITINKKQYRAHRLAWLYVYGEMPDKYIIHINGDKLDYRIENLKIADKIQRKPRQPKNQLTQERLKEVLSYDEMSGWFTWKEGTARQFKRAGGYQNDNYRAITVDGISYFEHRLVWLYVHGRWPYFEIDHLNGQKDDNRLENLRDVTHEINARNRRIHKGQSPKPAITRSKRDGFYRTGVSVYGKYHPLGKFESYEEAFEARKRVLDDLDYHEDHNRVV